MSFFGDSNQQKSKPDKQRRESKDGERPPPLFKDVNQLRSPPLNNPEATQDALDRQKLNDTPFGKLAGSKRFEYTTLSVIVANALFLGYDADFSARFKKPASLYDCSGFAADSCWQFIIFENCFAFYFTFEVVVRFFSYKNKMDHLKCDNASLWFIFDSTLVLLMVIETWVLPVVGASGPLAQLSILRLLRLLRITRMAKLMRFFPELQIIVKGMLAAVRSVVCTAILLILILYVWSILFTSEFHQGDADDNDVMGNEKQLFGSMGKSMRHLFIMGTILDDLTMCTNYIRLSNKSTSMLTMFIIFVLISSFTMLNMLIGILCEVVCATGEGEREKNMRAGVREAITDLFKSMDRNSDGQITRDEFMSMRHDKKVMTALQNLRVKSKHFDMYAQLLFMPEENGHIPTINFEKLINMIMRLKPEARVSALDFTTFQMAVFKNHDHLGKGINAVLQRANFLPLQGNPELVAPALQYTPDVELIAELEHRMKTLSKDFVSPANEDMPHTMAIVHAPASNAAIDTETRACLRCGFAVPVGNRFCGNCGMPQYVQAGFHNQLPGNPDPIWSQELFTC